jgi:hypothetical protein
VIVLIALLGIPLSGKQWRDSLAILVTLAYVGLVFVAYYPEARFGLPSMPFMIIMSAYAIDSLACSVKGIKVDPRRKRIYVFSIGSVILLLLSMLITVPLLLQVFPYINVIYAHIFVLFVRNIFLLSLIPVVYFLVLGQVGQKMAMTVSLLPILMVSIIYNTNAFASGTWHEWKARLSDPSMVIRQEIRLPEDISQFQNASLKIDMLEGPGRSYDLVVRVNEQGVKRYSGGLSVDDNNAVARNVFYRQVLQLQNKPAEKVRQWFSVPIDFSFLVGRDKIYVDIAIERKNNKGNNYVDVFGDYQIAKGFFEGPSLNSYKVGAKTSFAKYLIEDDFRLWDRTKIESNWSSSVFYNGSLWSTDDLSSDMGMQSGSYRIRLQLERGDGSIAAY